MPAQTPACPECAAPLVNGLTCWEQLGAVLAWEVNDPELAAEHFLTVACYNLQHPAQFTDEALAWLRSAFADHLDRAVAVGQLRRRAGRQFEGRTRVLRPASEQSPTLRQWNRTVADVYLPDRRAGAAERVRAWAAAVREGLD